MNQPPLNPDAFDAAWEALYEAFSGRIGDLNGNDCERMAETAIQAYLAAALPEVTSVESIPAKMRMLMWEGGEVEVGEIPDGFVLVGFEMETDRAWSMADKVTINIERREVKP